MHVHAVLLLPLSWFLFTGKILHTADPLNCTVSYMVQLVDIKGLKILDSKLHDRNNLQNVMRNNIRHPIFMLQGKKNNKNLKKPLELVGNTENI